MVLSPGAGRASAARGKLLAGHHSGRNSQCRAGSAPLRAPQWQGKQATKTTAPPAGHLLGRFCKCRKRSNAGDARGCAPCIPAPESARHWEMGANHAPSGGCAFGVASLAQNRQEAVPYEQCRQPRRGGTGGEELRRLRWSSPPGQVEQVPQGANCSPGTTAARIASAARVQLPCGHQSGRANKCRRGSAPLRAPHQQG